MFFENLIDDSKLMTIILLIFYMFLKFLTSQIILGIQWVTIVGLLNMISMIYLSLYTKNYSEQNHG